MTCRSCGLGLNTSPRPGEGILDPWLPTSYLGPLGVPTPVSQNANHQCLDANDPLRHGNLLENFSTMAGSGWPTSTLAIERNPFSIDHDPTEYSPGMSFNSVHGLSDHERRYGATTEPKKPPQPAKRTTTPSGGTERRVKKTRCGHRGSSRPW